MNWYYDIIANDSNIFLNPTIMCVCFKEKKRREKIIVFLLKKIIYNKSNLTPTILVQVPTNQLVWEIAVTEAVKKGLH